MIGKAVSAGVVAFASMAALALSTTEASATWVVQTDAWCSHHGFSKGCEIWVPVALTDKAGSIGTERRNPDTGVHKAGEIKGLKLPASALPHSR